jgi:hypothetical protein
LKSCNGRSHGWYHGVLTRVLGVDTEMHLVGGLHVLIHGWIHECGVVADEVNVRGIHIHVVNGVAIVRGEVCAVVVRVLVESSNIGLAKAEARAIRTDLIHDRARCAVFVDAVCYWVADLQLIGVVGGGCWVDRGKKVAFSVEHRLLPSV